MFSYLHADRLIDSHPEANACEYIDANDLQNDTLASVNTISWTSEARALDISQSYFIQMLRTVNSAHYPLNPYVMQNAWEAVEPAFLPTNHPIKHKLDKIFYHQRAILSQEAFEKAGFQPSHVRGPLQIVLGSHPKLPGYLIKTYFDTHPSICCDWCNWITRVHGAEAIRECIKRHGFEKYFKVPRKWIYPLPAEPSPPLDIKYSRKNFILIVEDMNILSGDNNLKAFRKRITKEMLQALYIVITELRLIDSLYPSNIPFNASGQINFIDTEHHHSNNIIKYKRLKKYLSPEMQSYWQELTQCE